MVLTIYIYYFNQKQHQVQYIAQVALILCTVPSRIATVTIDLTKYTLIKITST